MITLHHRLATLDDTNLYFDWANDPDTRRQSFRTEVIPLDTHRAWFLCRLTDSNALLLVFETDDGVGQPVGQVRFTREADGRVVVGISVAAGFRGQGLASRMIDAACAVCVERWGAVTVLAFIRPENQASTRAFERAGFVESHRSEVAGVSCLLLTRNL